MNNKTKNTLKNADRFQKSKNSGGETFIISGNEMLIRVKEWEILIKHNCESNIRTFMAGPQVVSRWDEPTKPPADYPPKIFVKKKGWYDEGSYLEFYLLEEAMQLVFSPTEEQVNGLKEIDESMRLKELADLNSKMSKIKTRISDLETERN